MKKQENYFRSNKIILVMMMLVLCFTVLPVLAAEKGDVKGGSKSEIKATVSATAKDQKTLCKKVSMLVKNKDIGKYAANSKSIPDRPQDEEYIDLDIDLDGKVDKVEVSSGSEGSYLTVKLSTGGKYALDEDGNDCET